MTNYNTTAWQGASAGRCDSGIAEEAADLTELPSNAIVPHGFAYNMPAVVSLDARRGTGRSVVASRLRIAVRRLHHLPDPLMELLCVLLCKHWAVRKVAAGGSSLYSNSLWTHARTQPCTPL